jgi:hypothetical protein
MDDLVAPAESATPVHPSGVIVAPIPVTFHVGPRDLPGIDELLQPTRPAPPKPISKLIGSWNVGYLPALGEFYAVRRNPGSTTEVWLLATVPQHRRGTSRIDELFVDLAVHMHEPNSLILAAETIRRIYHDATEEVGNDDGDRRDDGFDQLAAAITAEDSTGPVRAGQRHARSESGR